MPVAAAFELHGDRNAALRVHRDMAKAQAMQLFRQAPFVQQLARRQVDIGERRRHRAEVEFLPPERGVGADAAIGDDERIAPRQARDLVRPNAVGRDFADQGIALLRIPDADHAPAVGDVVLTRQQVRAIRNE